MTSRLDPTILLRDIDAIRLRYPEVWDDEDAKALTLASETTFDEWLTARFLELRELKGDVAKVAEFVAADQKRKQQLNRRLEAIRALILKVLQSAELRSYKLPLVTYSIGPKPQAVLITLESALPPDCFKREPDITKIRERLMRGEAVPGAALSNREDQLTVR